jgi:hypothetical protein
VAPAPAKESGAGLARGEESRKSLICILLTIFANYFLCQLEEKKKLDQLRKELEEERQLQELQRLQEEQTGKKRSEKLEWMYATPASGSGTNQNELEEYLLGKKRVDKMLTGDENAKVRRLPSECCICHQTSNRILGRCRAQELHRCPERE